MKPFTKVQFALPSQNLNEQFRAFSSLVAWLLSVNGVVCRHSSIKSNWWLKRAFSNSQHPQVLMHQTPLQRISVCVEIPPLMAIDDAKMFGLVQLVLWSSLVLEPIFHLLSWCRVGHSINPNRMSWSSEQHTKHKLEIQTERLCVSGYGEAVCSVVNGLLDYTLEKRFKFNKPIYPHQEVYDTQHHLITPPSFYVTKHHTPLSTCGGNEFNMG